MQGQSKATPEKIKGLQQLLGINLRVFNRSMQKHDKGYRYHHFDMNAGSGFNDDAHVIGSPLAFLRVARQRAPYVAHFVDNDLDAATKLAKRREIAGDPWAFVYHGDNSDFCDMIPELIRQYNENPQYAMGSVFIDPNRPTGDVSWEKLKMVFEICNRLDVIVNFPSTGMKRIGRGHKSYISIHDLPFLLGKKYWLIRDPKGPWQWCLAIGRNFRTNDYEKAGFVHWESDKGQMILDNIYYTKKELDDGEI